LIKAWVYLELLLHTWPPLATGFASLCRFVMKIQEFWLSAALPGGGLPLQWRSPPKLMPNIT
jgi:hypothetical protein